MSDQAIASVELQVFKGEEKGAIRLQQSGSGNVLLRFEALLLAARQILKTALQSAAAHAEPVDDEFVTQVLADYAAGRLQPAAEQMVMMALDALTPASG